LSGACIAFGSFPRLYIAVLVTFVPIIGWIAGLCLSDYFDRQLDTIQKAHRPIPSGRIKSYEVLVIGAFFAVIGLVLSSYLGLYNVFISFVAAALVLFYARFSKSRGIIGNINRGLITGTAFFFGVFSINNSFYSIPIYIWFISLIFIIHDINSNLIGAIRDMEGDKRGGYSTFPVKYGIRMSISASLILTIIWISLTVTIPIYFDFLNTIYYLILALVFIIILLLYFFLFKSLYVFNRKKALKAHEFFVVERITLASAFIFGTSTVFNASIILIIAVTITLLMQYLLRGRYEFGKEI
jgi:4-hydroxybenzoate polyprenyltransferase/geranylgeranylglycerol-phosphate geranylgeranyltransferase